MRLAILVVLYNKKLEDSTTLKSLAKNVTQSFDLFIFNNGPHFIEKNDAARDLLNSFKTVSIDEDLNNRSLSAIYNSFIEDNEFDYYLLFDDDSYIEHDFFIPYSQLSSDVDLQVPIIYSNYDGAVYYPKIDEFVIESSGKYKFQKGFISIGSGLGLSKSLKEKFKSENMEIFDTRFALYGVDFSLFRRMNILCNKEKSFTINVHNKLNHSLSKVENSEEVGKSKERLIARVLSILHYSDGKIVVVKQLLRQILREMSSLKINRVLLILKLILLQKHPRSS